MDKVRDSLEKVRESLRKFEKVRGSQRRFAKVNESRGKFDKVREGPLKVIEKFTSQLTFKNSCCYTNMCLGKLWALTALLVFHLQRSYL